MYDNYVIFYCELTGYLLKKDVKMSLALIETAPNFSGANEARNEPKYCETKVKV